MEQYVITGIGAFNGLGSTAEISWSNLLAGKTAIQKLNWPEDNPTQFPATYSGIKAKIAAIGPKIIDTYPEHFAPSWNHWDQNTRAALLSVDQAFNDAQLTSKNVGVVFSTFGSGTSLRLEVFAALTNGVKKVSPRKILNIGLDFPAAQISAIYKVTGPNTSMDSACTTGLTSIDTAINTLKANSELDAMVVGGSDYMAEPFYLYWFQNLGAISLSDDVTASCPFDKSRHGFVMGEGSATVIIEPLSKAKARGAKIYAVVNSTSFITLFDSDTSPDPEGIGAKLCVQQALDKAGITADQINYINAHATSTPTGDQIEFDAMQSIAPDRVMVSNKGQIGHAMSASGIIETIYTVLSMRDSISPGNANLTEPLGTGMNLINTATPMDIKYAIKNSFGFGGRNASIILERYDG
jgi:3-oxoacyl-[acyl-carrier-protein] synthase II